MSRRVDAAGAAELLRGLKEVGVLIHRRPDGDAVGSAFALRQALGALGIRCRVLCPDPIPEKFSFLAGGGEEEFQPLCYVAVDLASAGMAGEFEQRAKGCLLCVDHHLSNEQYAENLLLDPQAASCCELLLPVIKAMGVPLTPFIATALYTGAATDTGCFLFRNTTAATHLAAAELMAAGADAALVNQRFFEQKSRSRLALELMVYESLEFYLGGRVAVATITEDMIKRSGATAGDLEGINGLARGIEGVEVGVTLREGPGGVCRASLRSNRVDSSAVCRVFGGGGHQGAAGFECTGEFADIKALLLRELEKRL